MNWETQGSWYSLEEVERHTNLWRSDEQDECRIDSYRNMVWIPHDLAQRKGFIGGGEWMPPRGDLKRPNDRGVLQFLAGVCREQVPA